MLDNVKPNTANDAARIITDAFPSDIQLDCATHMAVNPAYIEPLADLLQLVIAIVISSIIDAGSERDVVLEDEALSTAITNAIKEWTP